MKSDPRENWIFNLWSRYSGLSHPVPSSTLPRLSHRELVVLVLSPFESSLQQFLTETSVFGIFSKIIKLFFYKIINFIGKYGENVKIQEI